MAASASRVTMCSPPPVKSWSRTANCTFAARLSWSIPWSTPDSPNSFNEPKTSFSRSQPTWCWPIGHRPNRTRRRSIWRAWPRARAERCARRSTRSPHSLGSTRHAMWPTRMSAVWPRPGGNSTMHTRWQSARPSPKSTRPLQPINCSPRCDAFSRKRFGWGRGARRNISEPYLSRRCVASANRKVGWSPTARFEYSCRSAQFTRRRDHCRAAGSRPSTFRGGRARHGRLRATDRSDCRSSRQGE